MERHGPRNSEPSGSLRGSVVVVIEDQRSPWDLIKEQLQKKLSAESFENWIARTKFAGIEGKTMLATAPDRQTAAFLVEEYGQQINAMAVGSGPRAGTS